VSVSDQKSCQQQYSDSHYGETRSFWFSSDPMTRFVTLWRLRDSVERFRRHVGTRFSGESTVLFLCAGEGAEASVCYDALGFSNVTFSDISPVAIATGLERDPRLKGFAGDAENTGLPDRSYDLVIVQDGLHHLSNPVRGFTEMLRIARVGVIFIEPHDVLVGKWIGTKWERNGEAVNFVFRWSKALVEQVASSYLGRDTFTNLSYSYWHHNTIFARIGTLIGQGKRGALFVKAIKSILDAVPGAGNGNGFSCIVVRKPAAASAAASQAGSFQG
jgi:ubiquinone/menaquinone biosynthesis C-methylase UbiE